MYTYRVHVKIMYITSAPLKKPPRHHVVLGTVKATDKSHGTTGVRRSTLYRFPASTFTLDLALQCDVQNTSANNPNRDKLRSFV